MDVLFFLLLGHFCGDYALQSDKTAEKKKSSKSALSLHVLIYVVCIWVFLAAYSVLYAPGLYVASSTIIFMAALYLEHWAQDYLKSKLNDCTRQMHFMDQVIHLAVLYIYRIFIFPY